MTEMRMRKSNGTDKRSGFTPSQRALVDDRVPRIERISVEGFKCIRERASIEFSPLTILAGANSSGKSSIMQPLLLLKQTFEAPLDPGSLLKLDGPNVRLTDARQCLSVGCTEKHPPILRDRSSVVRPQGC